MKLYFSELAEEDAFEALVHEQVALHRSILARYEALWRRYGGRPEYARRTLPLRVGLRIEREQMEFWEELADEQAGAVARSARRSAGRA